MPEVERMDEKREMYLLGEKYIRSDLAAEMLGMHRNTLLHKAKEGKIRRFMQKRTVWFKEVWLREYIERSSA